MDFKKPFFTKFDEDKKLGKATEDTYNQGRWPIL